jgi:hypothetical protein
MLWTGEPFCVMWRSAVSSSSIVWPEPPLAAGEAASLAPGDDEPPLGDAVGATLPDGDPEAAGEPDPPGDSEAPGEPAAAVAVATGGAYVQPAEVPLAHAASASTATAANGISRGVCRRDPPAGVKRILMAELSGIAKKSAVSLRTP